MLEFGSKVISKLRRRVYFDQKEGNGNLHMGFALSE